MILFAELKKNRVNVSSFINSAKEDPLIYVRDEFGIAF
jgi:hypothetical protein